MFLVLAFAVTHASAAKPNVLLICVDDLKPTLGCYGDPVAQTPHIDSIAARGVQFNKAYCNQAVCSPSRNALMTGLRPQTIGVYDLPTFFRNGAPDAITLGQFLKSNGYHAESLGKIYHRGHGNGDDADTWSVPHWNPPGPTYQLPKSTADVQVTADGKKRYASTERADVADDSYADGQTAIEAAKRIKAAAAQPDQPFFLAVGFIRPHLPFVAPEKYWAMYDPNELPMPELDSPPKNAPSFAPTTWGELRNYSDIPAKGTLTSETTRHLIHGYYAATSYTDAQVGLVLKTLSETGLDDNTLIVFWGDHGWHLGDHGMWCKHTNYEQAARIPLIIATPDRQSAGSKTDALIETVDIYPTVAALARLGTPPGLDGVSQAAVISDPTAHVRDHAIGVYPRSGRLGRAIRTQDYRLVQWRRFGADESEDLYELYDYVNDPLETENRIDQLPTVAAELKALLAQHPDPRPPVPNKLKYNGAQFKSQTNTKAASAKKDSTMPFSELTPEQQRQKREQWFDGRDADGDGKITRKEFGAKQDADSDALDSRFARYDTDGDGALSREEFVAAGKK
ncbi:sulfatase-like hydrolase/transferase [Stieleria varia]|uniref:sulfatase-like hydrolase/transferase n=1 Tax=Stieleria varia TaxID=2528005 RepID=UPI001E39E31B|nr:sulfatase-like hydrolase/transferase [Stieleria varia]